MTNSYTPFQGIKNVLVVFSSRSQAFDEPALVNFIQHAYPGSKVFFKSTSGHVIGSKPPVKVDLLIDFTQPGARQALLFPWALRRKARFAIGRNAGFYFRSKLYDRIYDEKNDSSKPSDYLGGETWAQKKVLELAGVPVIRQGGVTPDRRKDIAFENR
jgi:aconitase B